jgi:hypothetical protein
MLRALDPLGWMEETADVEGARSPGLDGRSSDVEGARSPGLDGRGC